MDEITVQINEPKKPQESQNIKWTQKFLKIEIEQAMSNEQISHNHNTDTKATVIP